MKVFKNLKVLPIVLSLVLLTVLSGCGEGKMIAYESDIAGLTIMAPETWEDDLETNDNSVVYSVSSYYDGVIIYNEDLVYTDEEILYFGEEILKMLLGDADMLTENEDILIDGQSAKKNTYKTAADGEGIEPYDKDNAYVELIRLTKDDSSYLIMSIQKENKNEDYSKIHEVINSIKFN